MSDTRSDSSVEQQHAELFGDTRFVAPRTTVTVRSMDRST